MSEEAGRLISDINKTVRLLRDSLNDADMCAIFLDMIAYRIRESINKMLLLKMLLKLLKVT